MTYNEKKAKWERFCLCHEENGENIMLASELKNRIDVNQIVEYIVQNGIMKVLSVLQKPPFTDNGSIVEIFTDLSLWSASRA